MRFQLIDTILEQQPDRIVAIKHVSLAEEYLADHFPTFPVMPGVLMVEAMVQAARAMLRGSSGDARLVLGEVKAMKFGCFVRPGEALRVEVTLAKVLDDGSFQCKATGTVLRRATAAGADETAAAGRFTMRPVKVMSDGQR